jgi:hypothetical protein
VTGHYRAPARLLAELGITDPEDIDVNAIAFYCGAMVIEGDLHGCEARLIGTHEKAIITVKRDGFPPRRRFSIGHELGHWMHDRGRANFRCVKQDFNKWGDPSPETLANKYAVDLLLPKTMFVPRASGRPFTHDVVLDLARTFQMSRTATAIRFLDLADRAMVIVFSVGGRIKWARRNSHVPFPVKLLEQITSDTVAYDVARGAVTCGPTEVAAAAWFSDDYAPKHSVLEDSDDAAGGVLSLLSWQDEAHLLEYYR